MNIQSSLIKTNNNFDFLRLLAAIFVIIGHSSDVLFNKPLAPDPSKWLFGFSMQSLGVLIFFIISGYLVTASFERKKSWTGFFAGRVLRIFPAVIVVVFLSVFILGPALTTLNLTDYFSHTLTKQYLQNISLYRMYYYLPGVFEGNPIGTSVNASLWTLPYEFTCYLYIGLAGLSTLFSGKWVSLGTFICYFAIYLCFESSVNAIVIPIIGIDFKTFFVPFLYFLSGSLCYKFRDALSFNMKGLVVCIASIIMFKAGWMHQQFLIPVITYLVLAIAFSPFINLHQTAKYGDFSYGLYLYAFPVQQLLVYFLPVNPGLAGMIVLSTACTFPFALFSWQLIEKRALKLKAVFH